MNRDKPDQAVEIPKYHLFGKPKILSRLDDNLLEPFGLQ